MFRGGFDEMIEKFHLVKGYKICTKKYNVLRIFFCKHCQYDIFFNSTIIGIENALTNMFTHIRSIQLFKAKKNPITLLINLHIRLQNREEIELTEVVAER